MGVFSGHDEKPIREAADKEEEMGNKLINFLGLKIKRDGKVDTEWGRKTAKGLWVTMERVMNDIKTGKM